MNSRYPQSDFLEYSNPFAALAKADERSAFITRTYMNLATAIFGLVALEIVLFQIPGIEQLVRLMIGSQASWLVVLGLFMGVSWIANSWALGATDIRLQYAGLWLYVVAQAFILLPLLYIAYLFQPNAILMAAGTTLALFGLLTGVVFFTRHDFSFLKPFLIFGGIAAFGLIVVSLLFGFQLWPIFAYAMVAFACCYILYDTSNIMHHYRTSQHAAAALALFASVVLLFWYLLQIFLSRRN
ncbi:MAG: Bax inhibitor-1 family protein [Planctomycetaceae bacterium]|nr:Bax inhibitor-1 family protein [Planctomycetaceae bacterium]